MDYNEFYELLIDPNQLTCPVASSTFVDFNYGYPGGNRLGKLSVLTSFLKNFESFKNLQNQLSQNPELRQELLKELLELKGVHTLKDYINQLFHRLVPLEKAKLLYSWHGSQGKPPFKNLEITGLILEAMRFHFPEADETLLENWWEEQPNSD